MTALVRRRNAVLLLGMPLSPLLPLLQSMRLMPLAALAPAPAGAQPDWRRVAVPVVSVPAFVAGVLRQQLLPRAAAFERTTLALARIAQVAQAAPLAQTAETAEAAPAAFSALRAAWQAALLDWAALSAISVGPLIERRSARGIDFAPTRPDALRRVIEARLQGRFDAAGVGGPAKGFGALEWLWWDGAAPRTPAARQHAAWVAAEIADEARALHAAFAALAATPPADEAAAAFFDSLLNQWIGGVQALRIAAFERPPKPGAGPRARALAPLERSARWAALQAMAVWSATATVPSTSTSTSKSTAIASAAAPAANTALAASDSVSLEMLLRGRGLNPLADRLRSRTLTAGTAMAAAAGATGTARASHASRALDALRSLAEAELAPAVDVRVGFSDADGD